MYVPHERRALILRLLEQRGYLRTALLARELNVTDETIRTDLKALHERRLLSRVHGGARFIPPTGSDEDDTRPDFQLAARAASHLCPHTCIYLDPGTAAHALIAGTATLPCTMLSPSPRMALALAAKAQAQQPVLPGGSIDKESALVDPGADAAAFFRRYPPDTALLFPQAVLSPTTIAYHHAARAAWAEAAARASRRTIIVAPAHAFYATAPHKAACDMHLIIAEDNLPDAFAQCEAELLPYISPEDLAPENYISLR